MTFDNEYDVIIVGGGPGGCIAAKECAEKGLSVLLLERHREIGIPVRCGEAVGIAGLLEFFDPDHPIVKKYQKKYRIRFVAPKVLHLILIMKAKLQFWIEKFLIMNLVLWQHHQVQKLL